MRKYSIEAPDYRRPSAHSRGAKSHPSQKDNPPPPRVFSDSEREAAVARYFVPFKEIVPTWEQRLKDMKLSRLNLPLMCRKLTDEEKKVLDMDEIKTWFFNRSEMDSSFRRIERKKADVFETLLKRVEECIKAGENFTAESGLKPYAPKTKPPEVSGVIMMTLSLRLRLKEAFELGQVTPREVHNYMSDIGLNNGLSRIAVNRWFGDKELSKGVDKHLLANFLAAAIALMETKIAPPKADIQLISIDQKDPSDYLPEPHLIQ